MEKCLSFQSFGCKGCAPACQCRGLEGWTGKYFKLIIVLQHNVKMHLQKLEADYFILLLSQIFKI